MTHSRIVRATPLTIKAPREFVWGILTDLPSYRLWNTLSPRVESTLRLGELVRLWVSDTGITGTNDIFEHRLLVFEPSEHIVWGYERGEVKTRRDQYLGLTREGCVYSTSDTFYGPLADSMMDQMGEAILNSFNRLAHSLRDFSERSYGLRSDR